MDVRTFRAPNLQAALALFRRELGHDAAVLHTREIRGGYPWRLIPGLRQIEVTASNEVRVPSRLPKSRNSAHSDVSQLPPAESCLPASDWNNASIRTGVDHDPDRVSYQLEQLTSMVEALSQRNRNSGRPDIPPELFHHYTDLIEAEFDEELARELIERVRCDAPGEELSDGALVKARLERMLEAELATTGPLPCQPGRRRIVALVGPTGVGKTTTIAKLAAHYRLREKCKVGLITVDTYRIAAVEQLRTYADIIDLPMRVVATGREMREALDSMRDLDLVLMDTAGRSPRDEVKIQELRALLGDARVDEVHLVLSVVASASSMIRTAQRFASVGTSALIATKLDEATGLGNLLPLLRASGLPLSYLTNGQRVPDDIEAADCGRLARQILQPEPSYV